MGKVVSTITTVADEREYYTLRTPRGRRCVARSREARRLRRDGERSAARVLRSVERRTRVPVAGRCRRRRTTDLAKPLRTISAQHVSDDRNVQAHALMPAFVFSNDGQPLHRVYISTDKDCVNIVHVGSIVGGTAYAPRITGPLALNPETWQELSKQRLFLLDGSEGKTLRFDGESVTSNEAPPTDASGSAASASGDEDRRAGARRPVGQQLGLWPVLLDCRAGREAPGGRLV